MTDSIVNKVADSGLITIDLENYLPKEEYFQFDLQPFLFMGLILKEKDFRESLKNTNWSEYDGKNVAVFCSADAVIPYWAYMLVVTFLQPVAHEVFVGTIAEMKKYLFLKRLQQVDTKDFKDQKVIIKGCGDEAVGEFAYAEITKILLPEVKSIMYGEPCSTVPVYKRK